MSEVCPPGVMSVIFAWQGPTDENPEGESRFYANNLIAGGRLQQPSNAAFYKNTRAKATKLDLEPITAESSPTMSLQDRTIEDFQGGVAGNPASRAKDLIEVPARPAPGEPPAAADFEAD